MVGSAQDAIIGILKNHRIASWNAGAQRIFGYEETEAVGQSFDTLLASLHPDEWTAYAEQFASGTAIFPLETVWRAKTGESIPISAALSPIKNRAGQILGMSIIARDLSQTTSLERISKRLLPGSNSKRELAELELRRLYEQTRQDAETKTELLREINHRVKNNLISILGLIQAEQRFTPNKANRPLVKEALEHLTQRVRGLIEVHHLLSETQWQPMALSELASRIIIAVATSLGPSKQITVRIAPSPVLISPRQANSLALALNELATNTLKYAAAGRMMTQVAVRIQSEPDYILLEYRDDGPGFPEDILGRQRQGVGLALLQQLATGAFRGSLTLLNDQGAVAVLRIKAEETDRT